MIGFLPKVKKYLPTFLSDGNSLIYGLEKADAYIASLVIAAFVSALCFAVSIPIFNKKSL
jgi:ABC-2 type transport system permease protein